MSDAKQVTAKLTTVQQLKEPKVATLPELLKEAAKLDADRALLTEKIAKQRVEEIKVLADAYVLKIKAAGYEVQEALDAVKFYLPAKVAGTGRTRAPKGSAKAKAPPKSMDSAGGMPQPNTTYADPKDPKNTWTTKALVKSAGKKLPWIAAGATWESLRVK